MNIAFTLCSINYLAQAKTLYESFKITNPGWKFIIGLVDKNTNNIDLSFVQGDLLEVEEINIEGFKDMMDRYTIVELLTSVKPYYFTWLFKTFKNADKIAYFDPDIMVFKPLSKLEDTLDLYDIVLTPHYTAPINDDLLPTELHIMQTGIYNLGFIAVKRTENTLKMLQWWETKLRTECIIDLTRGLFVDQLWANLIPAYFDKVLIEKYPGYNMAHWNLHERTLTKNEDGYTVNFQPLIFYHFSHYSPTRPDQIAAFHTRFNFHNRPDLVEIYDKYKEGLLKANYTKLKKVACFYVSNEKQKKRKKAVENFLRQALPDSFKSKLKGLIKNS
jgi:hypothetical protein